jgi:hypothetical protein
MSEDGDRSFTRNVSTRLHGVTSRCRNSYSACFVFKTLYKCLVCNAVYTFSQSHPSFYCPDNVCWPIPVAEWSKAWVCSRSPAGIAGLSGGGLCDVLITHPEESYRLCRVIVCDLGTSRMRRLKPASGL